MNETEHMVLPETVSCALTLLERRGYETWCVGGCVRDALLGRPPGDYDLATAASWQEVERTLGDAGYGMHRTGVKHGTVTAALGDTVMEITTFRSDGAYSDGRHPDEVSYVSSIREDLARRDFTVNALAYHPERGLLDCEGGRDDLRAGILRAVGDPARRFSEDGLRILRGCRFSSQLGLRIEPDTLQAMKSHKARLLGVSAERLSHEMDALLMGEHVHDALMETVDVLTAVVPEAAACKGFDQHTPYHVYDVWEHTAWVVQRMPATRLGRWAALLHDIGKPAACFFEGSRAHFYGHARLSARLAAGILGRLAVSPSFTRDVIALVETHDVQIEASRRGVRRMLAQLGGDVGLFRVLVQLKRADALAHSELGRARVERANELERVLNEVVAANEAFTVGGLAIDGHDVMACGIAPGPEVGRILHAALEEVVEGRLPNDRDRLLAFLAGFGPPSDGAGGEAGADKPQACA